MLRDKTPMIAIARIIKITAERVLFLYKTGII